jgi:uncharacterized cupredoxin-like copper-binding protein
LLAHEYNYDMPATVPAGLVRIELRNQGQDVHEALLVQFTDSTGSARAYVDSVRAHVDFPAFATDVGGPGLTLPGESSTVWLSLPAGRYAFVCWKGNHLSQGMAHDLTVTRTARPGAPPPEATADLSLLDYTFHLASPLTSGRHILHIRNDGTELHEADIFRLPGATSVQDYIAWHKAGEVGRPPADPIGGLGDMAPGRELWMALVLTPGRYFIICQIPARGDGRPHSEHGMILEFTVS